MTRKIDQDTILGAYFFRQHIGYYSDDTFPCGVLIQQ